MSRALERILKAICVAADATMFLLGIFLIIYGIINIDKTLVMVAGFILTTVACAGAICINKCLFTRNNRINDR